MIYVLGGGGGSAYAFIIATYPEGSVITCTNSVGKRKLSNNKIIYYVKKPHGAQQICTLTSTDGVHTATKNVTIEYEGQSIAVTLAYEYVIFENGVLNSDMGGLVRIGDKLGGSTWTISGGKLYAQSSDSSSSRGYFTGTFNNAILVDESRRHLFVTIDQFPSGALQQLGIGTARDDAFSSYLSPGAISSPTTVHFDLGTSNKYFKVYSWGGGTIKISRIWAKSENVI